MKHAEKLIARILFLEGRPIVSNLKKINIGAEVPAQHQNDWDAEDVAIKSYNDGIRLAVELGDNGSRELWNPSSRTRKITSTGSKPNSTRSSRWASRITWWNRSINLAGRGVG